jgi:DNA repair exonuclease SbcCD nuclease subunit
MSKIAILGDIHLGARNDSPHVMKYQLDILRNRFIPFLTKHKITEVICLGDLFDRRQYTNHRTLDRWMDEFFNPLQWAKIKFHLILGNHDLSLRNSLKVNSPSLFLSHYENIIIHDTPIDVEIGGNDFLILPWICAENYDISMDTIANSKSSVAFGHLELSGFEMNRGQVAVEGMSAEIFSRFEYVFSGHYHHKSDDGKIHYLGSPFEFTWGDHDDHRGFHVFDTESFDLEFIENDSTLFQRYEYNDKDKDSSYWKTFDLSNAKGKFVKLVVSHKSDTYQFDRLLDLFYNCDSADFKVIEDVSGFDSDVVDDDDLSLEDSMSLVDTYIDASEFDGNKESLKHLMKALYVESLSILE